MNSHSPARRVVITGIGVISPLGINADAFWDGLTSGRSGVKPAAANGDAVAGTAEDFRGHIDDFGELPKDLRKQIRKALKVMNRSTQMGLAAAQQAITDSQLAAAGFDPERVGVSFGAGHVPMMPQDFVSGIEACRDEAREFHFERWGTDGIPEVAPLWLLTCLPNMPACHIAIYNDYQGPNNSITQREAAANMAIAEAWKIIADGEADAMVSGGTGTSLLPMSLVHTAFEQHIARSNATERSPASVCRPFDRGRSGAVVAEGAAAVVLESLESAERRGATIYGEIRGGGSSCVVSRSTAPQREQALVNAMRSALHEAGMSPDGIGHVHAHGLSDRQTDVEEARAIGKVFRQTSGETPVVAAKSHMGNAEAGAGAMELAASLLALKHGHLFPILNYESPDPECPVQAVTDRDRPVGDSFLNLSVTPAGQASCLVVSRCDA